MVKKCLSVFDHFVGLALKGLGLKKTLTLTVKKYYIVITQYGF